MRLRFQERYDKENLVEKISADATIADEIVALNNDDDQISIEPRPDHSVKTKRQGYTACEDCDIPFITKKELKVNFQMSN